MNSVEISNYTAGGLTLTLPTGSYNHRVWRIHAFGQRVLVQPMGVTIRKGRTGYVGGTVIQRMLARCEDALGFCLLVLSDIFARLKGQ